MNSDNLTLLRARVAELEAAEAAAAAAAAALKKKENAMDRLQAILAEKNQALARNSYSKSVPLAAYYDRQHATLIDTLVDIIDGLHTRICNLEEAQKPADPGHLSGISEAVAAEIAEGISQGNALRA